MRSRIGAVAAVGAGLILALCGCTVTAHASLTDSPSSFSTQVASALTKQVGGGQQAKADCGDDPIDLINGNKVYCSITSVSDPTPAYQATVKLSEVHGTKYHISIAVAQTPMASGAQLPHQTK